MRLKGKVALVTGAAQGIGREICLRFAAEGAKVCASDLDKDGLETIAAEINAGGGKANGIKTDIGREAEVEHLFIEALQIYGSIDILVNNVGVLGPVAPIHKIDSAEWKGVVETNLNGTYYCIKHALKTMIPDRAGNIINIGSVAAVINPPNRSVYSATKNAIVTITRTVAAEVGPYNIRCNCISPGAISGQRLDKVIERNAKDEGKTLEEMTLKWLDQIPLRRFMSAADIAKAAVFFANDESSAITGQNLCVSGGQEIL